LWLPTSTPAAAINSLYQLEPVDNETFVVPDQCCTKALSEIRSGRAGRKPLDIVVVRRTNSYPTDFFARGCMATISRTATEIEAMIMERLRWNPACAALARVEVVPEGDEGGWDVHAQPRMGMTVLEECMRAIGAVVTDLRRADIALPRSNSRSAASSRR
jgi:hypothetical protein